MICSFPWCALVLLGVNFDPLLSAPVQYINGVESLFVWSSTPENYNTIVFSIVVHWAVRSVWRQVARSLDLWPTHSHCVEAPNIIHIVWIWIIFTCTCISSKENYLFTNHAAVVSPAWNWLWLRFRAYLYSSPCMLVHILRLVKEFRILIYICCY